VTYELLTGKLPFTGETAMSIAYKHLSGRVPRPSSVVPQVPKELDGFVLSATDRDRELRPESATEMRRDLESLMPSLSSNRSLAAVVGDLPEITMDAEVTEHMPPVAPTTQTIPRVERTRRRRGKKILGVVLLVLALAATAWGAWAYVIPHSADVPVVVGLSLDEARTQLDQTGFRVKIAETGVFRLNVPVDAVVSVDPEAGTSLQEGATVTLVLSLGPKPVPVPDLAGKTLDEARILLGSAHLTLGTVEHEYSDEPEDTILEITSEVVDGKAPRNSAIDVVVSKGPRPVRVPNVVGATLEDAERALEDAGFVVDDSRTKFSTEIERGRVIKQTPADGRLQPGETVTIVVSLGPKHFTVPDFRGRSKEAAQALADQYGLVVAFSTVPNTPGTIVFSQSPGVGATVTYGDTITLYLV
jgi:serine/threonine-protein kinase